MSMAGRFKVTIYQ